MSSQIITDGTIIKCDQSCSLTPGTPVPDSGEFPPGAPGSLVVLTANMVFSNKKPVANINDNKPNVNIPPFVTSCKSKTNPTVISASAAATAAAAGIKMFVAAPCTPIIPPLQSWSSGSPSCNLCNFPLVTKNSTLQCAMGGTISISSSQVQNVKIN